MTNSSFKQLETARDDSRIVQFSHTGSAGADPEVVESGPDFVERWWVVITAVAFAIWGGLTYLVFTSLGWWGRGIAVAFYAAALLAIIAVVRGGRSAEQALPQVHASNEEAETEELEEQRKAA